MSKFNLCDIISWFILLLVDKCIIQQRLGKGEIGFMQVFKKCKCIKTLVSTVTKAQSCFQHQQHNNSSTGEKLRGRLHQHFAMYEPLYPQYTQLSQAHTTTTDLSSTTTSSKTYKLIYIIMNDFDERASIDKGLDMTTF